MWSYKMKPSMVDVLKDLEAVFGESVSSGAVMIAPSGITIDLVSELLGTFDLEPIMKDLGLVTARVLADKIESLALRPADYANLPDLATLISQRLMHELAKDDVTFAESLVTNLRLRG